MPLHLSPAEGLRGADGRDCLRGIVSVLPSGISWRLLRAEAFGVSGSTCRRRLQQRTTAGMWAEVHRRLLNRLGQVDRSFDLVDPPSASEVEAFAAYAHATLDHGVYLAWSQFEAIFVCAAHGHEEIDDALAAARKAFQAAAEVMG
ncbi:MAG: transposase [Planctomycetota bacterium]|jgi:transposase